LKKKQKREGSLRAFSKGYQLGYQGRSEENCPFNLSSNVAKEWLRGWREGRDDQFEGINIQASQQKIVARQ
jgi:ribosome modulation factor